MKKPELGSHLRPRAWLHSLVSKILGLFAALFADVRVEGLENIPSRGGLVVIANHRSYFDAIALAVALDRSKRDAMVLAKSELFNTRLKAFLLRQVGTIPVYRGTANAIESLQEAVRSLRHGEMVVLFPEGTIPQEETHPYGKTENLGAFKTGAVRMSLAAEVPIVMASMVGTDHVIARNLQKVKRTLTRRALKSSPIHVRFSRPFEYTGSPEDRYHVDMITQHLWEQMSLTLNEMDEEMERIKLGKRDVGLLVLLATPVVGRIVNRVWAEKKKKKKQ